MNKIKLKKYIITKKSSIKNALKVISSSNEGFAFICNKENKLLGYLQDGDIRRALLKNFKLSDKVEVIMNKKPFTIPNTVKKNEAYKILRKLSRLRAPIVDNKNILVDFVYFKNEKKQKFLEKKYHSILSNKIDETKKTVLILGGAGYIGTILSEYLLIKNYNVKVIDKLSFGFDPIKKLNKHKNYSFYKTDVFKVDKLIEIASDCDAIIHLSAIVGDQASELNYNNTINNNFFSVKIITEICKYLKIQRYIFASTCSVYGASANSYNLKEDSKLKPYSLYAETKIEAEKIILSSSSNNFFPTILRLATVFGISYRPRFDLLINTLSARAYLKNKLTVYGGDQIRPNIHVYDVAVAFEKVLSRKIKIIDNQIFNVGSDTMNYKIIDLAKIVNRIFTKAKLIVDEKNIDQRNYHVNFDKINSKLDFKCSKDIIFGIKEIEKFLKRKDNLNININSSKFNNFKSEKLTFFDQ